MNTAILRFCNSTSLSSLALVAMCSHRRATMKRHTWRYPSQQSTDISSGFDCDVKRSTARTLASRDQTRYVDEKKKQPWPTRQEIIQHRVRPRGELFWKIDRRSWDRGRLTLSESPVLSLRWVVVESMAIDWLIAEGGTGKDNNGSASPGVLIVWPVCIVDTDRRMEASEGTLLFATGSVNRSIVDSSTKGTCDDDGLSNASDR